MLRLLADEDFNGESTGAWTEGCPARAPDTMPGLATGKDPSHGHKTSVRE